MMKRSLVRVLVAATALAILGVAARALWHAGLGHSVGTVLLRFSAYLAIGGVVIAFLIWVVQLMVGMVVDAFAQMVESLVRAIRYLTRTVGVGLRRLLQLLGSGGLDLLVDGRKPRVSPRTRSVLRAIGSGGLSLLVMDPKEGSPDEIAPLPDSALPGPWR